MNTKRKEKMFELLSRVARGEIDEHEAFGLLQISSDPIVELTGDSVDVITSAPRSDDNVNPWAATVDLGSPTEIAPWEL